MSNTMHSAPGNQEGKTLLSSDVVEQRLNNWPALIVTGIFALLSIFLLISAGITALQIGKHPDNAAVCVFLIIMSIAFGGISIGLYFRKNWARISTMILLVWCLVGGGIAGHQSFERNSYLNPMPFVIAEVISFILLILLATENTKRLFTNSKRQQELARWQCACGEMHDHAYDMCGKCGAHRSR